jgi:hypothetical protein
MGRFSFALCCNKGLRQKGLGRVMTSDDTVSGSTACRDKLGLNITEPRSRDLQSALLLCCSVALYALWYRADCRMPRVSLVYRD